MSFSSIIFDLVFIIYSTAISHERDSILKDYKSLARSVTATSIDCTKSRSVTVLLWRSTCCNPFSKKDHSATRKSLRPVSKCMYEKDPNISMGSRICDRCTKKFVTSHPNLSSDNISPIVSPPDLESSPNSEALRSKQLETRDEVNQCLEVLG